MSSWRGNKAKVKVSAHSKQLLTRSRASSTHLTKELFEILDATSLEFLLKISGHLLVVVVQQFLHIEFFEPLEDTNTDATSAKGSNDLP